MGDNYYRDQRPSSAGQYAPPHQGYQPQPQYGGRPNEGYSPYTSTTSFQPQQPVYNTYQPPRDDGYRPPRNDQLGNYRDDYDDRRRHEHHGGPRAGEPGYYAPPPHSHGDRSNSRRSSKSGREKHGHEAEKSVGATLLGGAIGGTSLTV